MSNELLFNKYRSNRFENVIGQESVTDAMKGLIETGNYKTLNGIIISCPQAGSGKTTLARIFAKAANCLNLQDGEPCGECAHCRQFDAGMYPDYIEVDGASYNKVEDIKRIIDIANMYPQVKDGYRFITIDECHRLSNSAWDVMLKLLEESTNKTIFLFATTEVYNVRPAIVSRCFNFTLLPLRWKSIYKILRNIVAKENIPYDDEILKQIAKTNEGKTRDAIKTLDTLYKCYNKIDRYEESNMEDLIVECMLKAFSGNLDDARLDADKLIKFGGSINDSISRALYSIQTYKEGLDCYLTYEVAERADKTFLTTTKDIIADFLVYKIDTIEQFKLFLSIVASKGLVSTNTKGGGLLGKRRQSRRFDNPVTHKVEETPKEEKKVEIKTKVESKNEKIQKLYNNFFIEDE